MARDHDSKLPTQSALREPILAALREFGGSASNEQIEEHVAAAFHLTDAQRAARHGGEGNRREFGYRLAWARTKLKESGAIVADGPKRWRLT